MIKTRIAALLCRAAISVCAAAVLLTGCGSQPSGRQDGQPAAQEEQAAAEEERDIGGLPYTREEWALATAGVRSEEHDLYDVYLDADLMGTVLELTDEGMIISAIYRNEDEDGNSTSLILFGDRDEDKCTVSFDEGMRVQVLDLTDPVEWEIGMGDVEDLIKGAVVSLWGEYQGDVFLADFLMTWSV